MDKLTKFYQQLWSCLSDIRRYNTRELNDCTNPLKFIDLKAKIDQIIEIGEDLDNIYNELISFDEDNEDEFDEDNEDE